MRLCEKSQGYYLGFFAVFFAFFSLSTFELRHARKKIPQYASPGGADVNTPAFEKLLEDFRKRPRAVVHPDAIAQAHELLLNLGRGLA